MEHRGKTSVEKSSFFISRGQTPPKKNPEKNNQPPQKSGSGKKYTEIIADVPIYIHWQRSDDCIHNLQSQSDRHSFHIASKLIMPLAG